MIDVTCAIIRNEENEVLVVQRGEESDHPLRWEFPGGKTKSGESHEDCIIREISEELSMDIVICQRLEPVEYDYGLKQIRLIPFICDTLDELPVLSEHISFKWVRNEILEGVDFCEADIYVARNYLSGQGSSNSTEGSDIQAQTNTDDTELQELINSMMSSREAEWVAVSAFENLAILNKLLEYSGSSDSKLAFRASWTLTKVGDLYPEVLDSWLNKITDSLSGSLTESVERSFLRILSLAEMVKLDERRHGLLADHCFSRLNSAESAIAIKAYSMEILYKLALIYPQLGNELAISIRLLMENGSAGIVARGTMLLKKITKIPLD